MKTRIFLTALVAVFLTAFVALPEWIAPEKAAAKKNPYTGKGIEEGAKLYAKNCASCHMANGTGMDAITKVDFTSKTFQAQTDGSIFYKVSEGRAKTSMAAYGDAFPEKSLWYMVNYIRTLKTK
ncbi:MAG: hypothetical protein AUJ98_01235 [Bacteroidetes bacterium CG2_30_33_31]|nr:MAG: hypothetical protein AUJ98_01235 [Bacteroidetes bacterium CG2_30_33_31]